MDFERELRRLADLYRGRGYRVTIRPGPEELPPFAKDFKVEIVGRRGDDGVLVAAKRNRSGVADDADMTRYAKVTGTQKGWRLDLAILEAEDPGVAESGGGRDFSGEEIDGALAEARAMVVAGFVRPAVIAAWAGFEAAMRMGLRAAGGRTGRGTSPRKMLDELDSSGLLTAEEFRSLEDTPRLRNQIVDGFASPAVDSEVVQSLDAIARRLLQESREATQPI